MTLDPLDPMTFSRVLALTRKFCHPPIDLENLTQEIISEHLSNNTLITGIAVKHRCYDALRSYRTQVGHEEAYARSDRRQSVPFDYTSLDELFLETELTSEERTVILLYYAHELTLAEIGQSLNLSVRKVSNLQWHGLEKLKQTARIIYG